MSLMKKRGRPKRIAAAPAVEAATKETKEGDALRSPDTGIHDAAPASKDAGAVSGSPGEPPPVVEERLYPGAHGSYTKIFVREGEIAPPAEPEPGKREKLPEPEFTPSVEVSVSSDADQRRLIDEYGELDRKMQLRAMDSARYETLKRAIKSWFDQAPADADGYVEGEIYMLHLSARERERKMRSMRELVDAIGIDRFLDLVTVSIGAIENLIGKAQVAAMTIDARTGSRRIKAIPKRAAAQG